VPGHSSGRPAPGERRARRRGAAGRSGQPDSGRCAAGAAGHTFRPTKTRRPSEHLPAKGAPNGATPFERLLSAGETHSVPIMTCLTSRTKTARRWLAALLLLAATLQASRGATLSVLGQGLSMGAQHAWVIWFNPTDSPEGAYRGTTLPGQQSIEGSIPRGRTLQPGRYYLSVKLYDYKNNGRLDVHLGGASQSIT